MTDKFTENLAKLEELLTQVKDATREGRELLKDIKTERKGIEEFKKQMQLEMRAWLESSVDEHIVPVLQTSFATLKPQIDNLYKKVAHEVGILSSPLEPITKAMPVVEGKVEAICHTLDKIEESGILEMLQAILQADGVTGLTENHRAKSETTGDSIVQQLLQAGVSKEDVIKQLVSEGVEVHHFRGNGDHVEYIWDEGEQKLRAKTADDET